MEKKVCSKCKEEKDICEFGKDKFKKTGYSSYCKSCINLKNKIWRDNNPIKKSLSDKNWRSKNLDKRKIYIKKYKKENWENVLKQINNRSRERYENDIIFKLKNNMRSRLSSFLKTRNVTKTNKTFDIVGCTPEFLKEHLETQFIDGMSWDNKSEWHIDHIIPLSSAKTEKEFYKLCNYTNLQPLWAEDNLKKSNK